MSDHEKTLTDFCIPGHNRDTTGMKVKALIIELKDDTLYGVIHSPSVIGAQNVPVLITALQAALFALEGECHNHPTDSIPPSAVPESAHPEIAVGVCFDGEG